jgi:hypothetical protein
MVGTLFPQELAVILGVRQPFHHLTVKRKIVCLGHLMLREAPRIVNSMLPNAPIKLDAFLALSRPPNAGCLLLALSRTDYQSSGSSLLGHSE